MHLIRTLRERAGVTQQALATAARTSQSAIAAYECGAKSPTLRTVDQLASALGLEMVADFVPRMSREDRRSLAFHRAVAEILTRDSAPTIARARRNLARLHEAHPHARALLDRWDEWLRAPPVRLAERMLDPGLEARDMRQVSPFSGLLPAGVRARILRQFRRDEGA